MKTPKYTDHHKYTNGYVPAANTNIEVTFRRVRREMEEERNQGSTTQIILTGKAPHLYRSFLPTPRQGRAPGVSARKLEPIGVDS